MSDRIIKDWQGLPPVDLAPSNLHLQLEPGEVVLDGEAERWRVVASTEGGLTLTREEWANPCKNYPDGTWYRSGRSMALRAVAMPRLATLFGSLAASDLTETTEHLDVYRSRSQQLANRVAELDIERDQLRHSLAVLISRIRRVGGYATPEEQDQLWDAERVCKDG